MAAVGWWWLSDGESAAAPQRPPTTVNVVPAISRPLSDNLEVVGTARATRAIVLVTQVDGRVDKIHFQESQDVEAGDLLVTLDARAARAETDRGLGATLDHGRPAAAPLGQRRSTQAERVEAARGGGAGEGRRRNQCNQKEGLAGPAAGAPAFFAARRRERLSQQL